MSPAIRAFRLAVMAAILLAWGLAARHAAADHLDSTPRQMLLGHTPVQFMSPGLRTAYILGIKEELAEHGYRPGPSEPMLDRAMREAIAAYQRDAGLRIDGVATKELLDHLKFALPKVYAARVPAFPDPAPSRPRLAPVLPEPMPGVPESRPDLYPGAPIPLLPQTAPRHEQEERGRERALNEGEALPAVPLVPVVPAPPSGRGGVVSEIQEELAERGYYDGAVDGRYDAETEAAVRRFQSDAGLPATGQIDTRLLDALLPEPEEVTEL